LLLTPLLPDVHQLDGLQVTDVQSAMDIKDDNNNNNNKPNFAHVCKD